MVNRSHVVVALIFVTFFGAGAVGFFFWLSNQDNATRTIVIVTKKTVGGISSQSPVKYKGLKVGHVDSVGFAPNDPSKVKIVFKVRASVPINQSSYAELATQGITGLSNVSLSTPNVSAPSLEGSNGQPPMLTLHQSLLDRLKSQGKSDMGKISTILAQIKKLTDDHNAKHISQMLAGISQATKQLNQIENTLQPTLDKLPGLTRQLKQAVARIDRLTQQAMPAVANVGKAAQSASHIGKSGARAMRQLNERLLPRIDSLTEQMRDAAHQIQSLSHELSAKPQSVLTGPPAPRPGPGEPGFKR